MFEHQTDIKNQTAFMSSVIYPLNKLYRAPLPEFMALDTRNSLSVPGLDVWQRPAVLLHKRNLKN